MNKTAIKLSIERKEERIKWYESRRKETGDNHLYLTHESVLRQEIELDKQLRDTTERDQIEEAYRQGTNNEYPENDITPDQYYTNTFNP